ncbi:MAG: NADP-dependent oxidoreductase [Candidatus Latescibacteria bacterium]|nr:NADP-dependent oxidoreductase [Candidatus Latescibacterota bacterium]
MQSRAIQLKRYPEGLPAAADFELVSIDLPDPKENEVLVKNRYMSVDPYMRGRMREGKSYFTPFALNTPLDGQSIGEVVACNHPDFKTGDFVAGFGGWREHFIAQGSDLSPIDPEIAPLQTFLGTLGMPGMTAYVGLLDIGRPVAGETVFVSAASGAVGSIVGQIAKIKGCRTIGSAGSDEKVAWLVDEAGFDAAFNYRRIDNLNAELARHCPDGIDVYFDNVGGEHLQAAIAQMNLHGRIALCGMIGQYNATEAVPGPNNLMLAVGRRLALQGFIVSDHYARREAFLADMSDWIAAGKIKWRETVVTGLEQAPDAFIGLFRGDNFGKMIVEL